jgi:polyisoprenoid-binding protein YceI
MTDMVKQSSKTHQKRGMPVRKHPWLRWAVAGLATVVVLAVAGVFVFIHLLGGAVPAPLALPKLNAAAAGTGSTQLTATWTAGQGSLAGYRVREDFLGAGNTMVGRTSGVTGHVVIAYNEATAASFQVDLATVTATGKSQFVKVLDTARFPDATVTLSKPVAVGSGLVMNKTIRVQVTGLLTMHGTTRPVTFQATVRCSGTVLEAAGSIPVLFSDWNVHTPELLQSHGLLEFLLVLRQ